MERQIEIRKAFNSFLPTPSRPDTAPDSGNKTAPQRKFSAPAGRPDLSGMQWTVLGDLQSSLRRHGIDAELDEIGAGILDALAARPLLCRGLLAAYLLDV